MTNFGHYPSFDVMKEQDEWDDHTQSIVASRLKPQGNFQFLTHAEAGMLNRICSILVSDQTPEVMNFVLGHIDQTLHKSPGEGQRKTGVPQAPELIREGLKAIDQGTRERYSASFLELDNVRQTQYLKDISESKAEPHPIWSRIPQEPLFQKLMSLTVEAYCSHPKVWSEIGYAGPAYPRGYVRTELGQVDPWEAKREP
ncbi:gluconate 2-dehydrogenase subunit 3 family protein [Cohnella thailandensis]|uniref:Gluconate 2-dehydrogenase subunit 3 family protein n=1 Tax=Cohnella thailandensis TaxID=557557 RepID=A0A841SXZ5_9BACL|nr:gluconate 2-dehydrogenase subunit 3 family protein [Cohnella thailandensis]MBB6637103.1 gluconate 2-dehydrogenase subunit 3 family protein [Cohnella thailandensis]MBP1973005.1 hypothetical protein [Cohnella thailandensis]